MTNTLKELIREAVAKHDGNMKAVKNRVKRQLHANKQLLNAVLDEIIELAN